MCELVLPALVQNIADSGKITDADVQKLRRKHFGDGVISREEAEQLFALDKSAHFKCEQWSYFFNDAIVDYVVGPTDGPQSITTDKSVWLMRCISRDGLVDSHERMEMLIKVLEKATQSPEELQVFALEQVKQGVLENQGPVDRGRYAQRLVLCKRDVELIRRLLFAFGGDNGMSISQMEAEFLFELNDKTIERRNDPAWSDLFVKAIANHLLATFAVPMPTRTIALNEDKFLEGESLTDFLTNSLRSVLKAMRPMSDRLEESFANANRANEVDYKISKRIDTTEKQWVMAKIKSDGLVHENERALLIFLKQEAANLPSELQELLAEAS